MKELVSLRLEDSVAIVTISNPPVNALSPGVPEGLRSSIAAAAADPAALAIVVIGDGRTFIAGADIREFGKVVSGEKLAAAACFLCCVKSKTAPSRLVMAIHGTADSAAGLEVAMAGHYRVMAPAAQVGQPEVKLGIIPGAAGTQRLPRLAGVAKAVRNVRLWRAGGRTGCDRVRDRRCSHRGRPSCGRYRVCARSGWQARSQNAGAAGEAG